MSGSRSEGYILEDCVRLQLDRNWLAARLCFESVWSELLPELDRIEQEMWRRIDEEKARRRRHEEWKRRVKSRGYEI